MSAHYLWGSPSQHIDRFPRTQFHWAIIAQIASAASFRALLLQSAWKCQISYDTLQMPRRQHILECLKGLRSAMSYRFVASLLTIAVPLQGFAVPHCHGESVAGQPSDHHQIRHFHFGHSHHHGHDHGDGHAHHAGEKNSDSKQQVFPSPAPVGQHDDDAVYVTSDLAIGKLQVRVAALAAVLPAQAVADQTLVMQRAFWRCFAVPPDYGSGDIFLKTASLRL